MNGSAVLCTMCVFHIFFIKYWKHYQNTFHHNQLQLFAVHKEPLSLGNLHHQLKFYCCVISVDLAP